MNTNYVPILLEVYHCASINKAAQNLFMSQPQISHIIRGVEEETGFPIFHRSRSGVTATPQGELYLESLRIISGELKKIEMIPAQFEEPQDISVTAVYSRFLFQAFLNFQEQMPAPGVTDRYMEDMYDMVIENVVSRKVRLGLMFRYNTLPGLISRQLDRYGLETLPLYGGIPTLVFMSRNHPLALKKSLTLKMLQNESIVYFQGADLEYIGQLLHRKTNVAQLLVSDRASMLEAVNSGKYISISSTSSDQVSEVSKYTYLPLEDLLYPSEACCIKPRLYKLTAREKQMLRFYKDTFAKYYGAKNHNSSDSEQIKNN